MGSAQRWWAQHSTAEQGPKRAEPERCSANIFIRRRERAWSGNRSADHMLVHGVRNGGTHPMHPPACLHAFVDEFVDHHLWPLVTVYHCRPARGVGGAHVVGLHVPEHGVRVGGRGPGLVAAAKPSGEGDALDENVCDREGGREPGGRNGETKQPHKECKNTISGSAGTMPSGVAA